jgi:hypothetical protein
MRDAPLIRTPEEITSEWLGQALGRSEVELLGVKRIGTGQMSQSYRVSFRGWERRGQARLR